MGAGTLIYVAYLSLMWVFGWVALKVPRSWEVDIGRNASQSILSEKRVCGNRKLNAFMGRMSRRLQKAVKNKPYVFRFKVIDEKKVNAFALPGGYVFVHQGLIAKAESGEEVAGVLAHEMQHVLQRHGMKRIVRHLGVYIVLRMIFGDVAGFVDLAAQGAAKLGNLKYDRSQEDEADMKGCKLLYRAGIDPRGLPKFFDRLAEKEKNMSEAERSLLPLLSTHPPSKERKKRLMRYIKKRGLPEKMRPLTGFAEIKDKCDPMSLTDPDKDPPGMAEGGQGEAGDAPKKGAGEPR